jgi:DNA polymerase III epsilon subunit-like protein
MIVLDIETSGIHTGDCGIWQIGAIDLENTKNYFLEEGRIDDEDIVTESALIVTGKTEKELRDKNKQSQKQLILNFLDWTKKCKEKLYVGQNVGWDINFIQNKCVDYNIIDEFRESAGQRGMDLHTFAQNRYHEVKNQYLLRERGLSDMNLKNILDFCGIPDKRRQMGRGEVKEEGTDHNALEDCKLEAECFSRLVYGKNLFPEYAKFKIPRELTK